MKIDELLRLEHQLLVKIDQQLSDQSVVLGVIMDALTVERPVPEQKAPLPPPQVALRVNPVPNGKLLEENDDYTELFTKTKELGKELLGIKGAIVEMDSRFRKLSEYTAKTTVEVKSVMDEVLKALKEQRAAHDQTTSQ